MSKGNKVLLISAAVFVFLFLFLVIAGCSKDNRAGAEELEMQMEVAKDNASFNANVWKAGVPAYSTWTVIPKEDSTQTRDFPQGDGVATVSLMNPEDPQKTAELKCSTYSKALGCRLKSDFLSSPLGKMENHCADKANVPYPYKRIATN